jgi:hypothetical protein
MSYQAANELGQHLRESGLIQQTRGGILNADGSCWSTDGLLVWSFRGTMQKPTPFDPLDIPDFLKRTDPPKPKQPKERK